MSFPAGNYVPKKINFELGDNSNLVDLIFYQDHSNRFYDTSIGIKTNLSKSKSMTTILETKSINGFSLNKNIIFNFNKIDEFVDLDFSYMYHDENIPTYISSNEDEDSPSSIYTIYNFNRKNTFYTMGYKINFNNLNWNILNRFNYQFSNYVSNNNINIDDDVLWTQLDLEYKLNDYIFFIKIDHKKNIIDISDNEQNTVDSLQYNQTEYNDEVYYNLSFLGFKYFNLGHEFSIGLIDVSLSNSKYDNIIEPCFNYKYQYLNYSFIIANEIVPYNKLNNIFTHSANYYNKTYFGIYYVNKNINQSLSIGTIDEKGNNYSYLSYSGRFDYKWIKSDYEFRIFEEDLFYINNSFNFNFGFYPKINNKSFDMYIKIHGNHLNLNSSYEIDFATLSLFSSTNSIGSRNINIFDGEIGIEFKNFNISFLRENITSELYYYSNNFLFPNRSNYLINIEWIFNE